MEYDDEELRLAGKSLEDQVTYLKAYVANQEKVLAACQARGDEHAELIVLRQLRKVRALLTETEAQLGGRN